MLDISTQTMINRLNLGHWILWQRSVRGQIQNTNLLMISCLYMHVLYWMMKILNYLVFAVDELFALIRRIYGPKGYGPPKNFYTKIVQFF